MMGKNKKFLHFHLTALVLITGALMFQTNLNSLDFRQQADKLGALLFQVILPGVLMQTSDVPEKGRLVKADLSSRTMRLYEDGKLYKEIVIRSIGKQDSPWETPTGAYKVKIKEKNHFSSIGKVWMPYSIQFFGNFFIHGWPYYSDGTLVSEGYSGGCIRISTEDAQTLFSFVKVDTPIIIEKSDKELGKSEEVNNSGSTVKPTYYLKQAVSPPAITADSVLVVDIGSNDLLFYKNISNKHPVGSLTKLMTALVSLELVNQFEEITVSGTTFGDNTADSKFSEGDIVQTGDLIYPLLLEGDTTVAETLAKHLGKNIFVQNMNYKATAIGQKDTHYADAAGTSTKNITTVFDAFMLARYIFNSKQYIYKITALDEYKIAINGGDKKIVCKNINPFIVDGEEGYYKGGMIDTRQKGAQSVVAIFQLPLSEFEDRNIAVIMFGSDDVIQETQDIISHLKDLYYYGVNGKHKVVMLPQKKEETLQFLSDSIYALFIEKMNGNDDNSDTSLKTLFEYLLRKQPATTESNI